MDTLKDLWIGDEVKITSTSRIGTFEGKHANGRAIIRSDNKTYLVEASDLELYTKPKESKAILFEETPQPKKFLETDSIDLHIEVLQPNMKEARAERILDIQIKAFEEFLQAAKESYKSEITIIHGKGAGVLKNCVMTIIKSDKDIRQYHSIHDGGAVRVVLK